MQLMDFGLWGKSDFILFDLFWTVKREICLSIYGDLEVGACMLLTLDFYLNSDIYKFPLVAFFLGVDVKESPGESGSLLIVSF